MLFCESTSTWKYASKAVAITSKSNGGLNVGITLTYTKAIDAIKNNAVILQVCCALAS